MATIIIAIQNADGTPYTGTVTVSAQSNPTIRGSVVISGPDLTLTPNSLGVLHVTLGAGAYYLSTSYLRPIPFIVPDDSYAHSFSDVIASGVSLAYSAALQQTYDFDSGNLLLWNATGKEYLALQLTAGDQFTLVRGALPAVVSRTVDGVLQLKDAAGIWRSICFKGTATAPIFAVIDSTTQTAAMRFRVSATDLQLPNIDAGGFHSITIAQGNGAVTLGIGPNVL